MISLTAKKHKMESGLPEEFIWRTTLSIIQGLNILHSNQMVHRDLKPANIFFANGTPKVGDFIVSKSSDDSFYQTKTGTPYYTAPEVWKGVPYTNKCDVWSLGCIIYEMCSIRPPFRANTLPELFIAVCKGAYPALS